MAQGSPAPFFSGEMILLAPSHQRRLFGKRNLAFASRAVGTFGMQRIGVAALVTLAIVRYQALINSALRVEAASAKP